MCPFYTETINLSCLVQFYFSYFDTRESERNKIITAVYIDRGQHAISSLNKPNPTVIKLSLDVH